jgi:hypothetical protein
MRRTLAVCLTISLATPPMAAGAAQSPPPQAGPVRATPSIESLGVSFERIKRELGEKPPSSHRTPLKLDFYVEVTAFAPRIQLFTPEELRAGPVPGGPPTHWEMVDTLWTKPEFRAPAVPISSLAIMGIAKLIQWQAQQAKKRKAEEERQRNLEELRKLYPDIVVREAPLRQPPSLPSP